MGNTSDKTLIQLVDMNRVLMDMFHMVDNEYVYTAMEEVDCRMVSVTECATSGFVFVQNEEAEPICVPEIVYNLARSLFETNSSFNKTFHKSFDKVAHADLDQLVIEQLVHYFSTYGLEAMGGEAHPWIPTEELEMPVGMPTKLVVIEMTDAINITNVVTSFFMKVKQPNYKITEAFNVLFDYVNCSPDDLTSFELQVIACDKMGLVPSNPVSVLRYIIYTLEGKTLIVNSPREAKMIKHMAENNYYYLYQERVNKAAEILKKADIVKMSSIFFRYKNLFLAMKKLPDCANYVNRMRRMAEYTHKPLNEVCVQNFTKMIAENNMKGVEEVINKADIFDLIKLLNMCRYRLFVTETGNAIYSIRNNRTFVKEDGIAPLSDAVRRQYYTVLTKIGNQIQATVDLKGKSFVVPGRISYAVPASQKQMFGSVPWGTVIGYPVDKAITMGVAWNNVGKQRVDLDLHMNSATQHFGWNGVYRNGEEVLFTGDMTDGQNGAAEAFYFKPEKDEIYCLTLALFCGANKVPFKFCMTETKPKNFDRNYTFDGSELIVPAMNLELTKEETTTGLGFVKDGHFTFWGGSLSNTIGGQSNYYGDFLKGITNRAKAMLPLENFIMLCGGNVYIEGSEDIPEDAISLMPEDLTADTILNIMKGEV